MKKGVKDKIDNLILDYLPKEKDNAILSNVLADAVKISERTLRSRISKLREYYPILADRVNGGYWISSDFEEIKKFSCGLFRQGNKLLTSSGNLNFIQQEIHYGYK